MPVSDAPARKRGACLNRRIGTDTAFAMPGTGRPPLYALRDTGTDAPPRNAGIVHGVGARPGNPDRLTLRPAILIREAEGVVRPKGGDASIFSQGGDESQAVPRARPASHINEGKS